MPHSPPPSFNGATDFHRWKGIWNAENPAHLWESNPYLWIYSIGGKG